jgi:hypothetical protein
MRSGKVQALDGLSQIDWAFSATIKLKNQTRFAGEDED